MKSSVWMLQHSTKCLTNTLYSLNDKLHIERKEERKKYEEKKKWERIHALNTKHGIRNTACRTHKISRHIMSHFFKRYELLHMRARKRVYSRERWRRGERECECLFLLLFNGTCMIHDTHYTYSVILLFLNSIQQIL